jgi:hypothetical protein
MGKIAQVNQSVDAIVSDADQTMAQRDALANSFLLHRGWFIINMTRKFKGKHFNLATGQYEAGHYESLVRTLKKAVKNLGGRETVKEIYEEHEIRNLIRVGVDVGVILLLVGLTNMLMAGDDDDDTFVENFAQLIAMRTVNETFSQNIVGIGSTAGEIYSDPLIQTRMITGAYTGGQAYLGFKDPEKKEKLWKQMLLFRRYGQLSDLQYQLDAYMHFNKSTLWGVTAAQKKKSER